VAGAAAIVLPALSLEPDFTHPPCHATAAPITTATAAPIAHGSGLRALDAESDDGMGGGADGEGRKGGAAPDTRYTRIGREMFFRLCSPMS
jgi:hypothetical protein